SKWIYPPYSATEVDGKIYGRGIVDDKAPAVLCLYALKELKDNGFIPSKKIKLILGCDEESGWECIEHYNKVAVMPNVGFSPDGDFPVIYAEKGIFHIEFSFEYNSRIKKLSGGERVNMVCDYATASIDLLSNSEIETLTKLGLKVEENTISAYGKSAHGSTPDKGDNAMKKLFYGLEKLDLIESKVYNSLFDVSSVFNEVKDETGNLTYSPDVCFISDNQIKVQVDIRYPATYSLNQISNLVSSLGNYQILHEQPPIISQKDGELVQTLLSIYNEEFEVLESPIAIGGGTYARALKQGVAFGPSFMSESVCHEPNEYMSITNMQKCYNVYLKAIKSLSK
ncbi:MAG: Sapep family Mn(2+)-dependent dipeptidase, partial [Clostridia bacterium]|nr:Sapep family Mn(2+)-dependent dipeptidase [Clostridia bacterium]